MPVASLLKKGALDPETTSVLASDSKPRGKL